MKGTVHQCNFDVAIAHRWKSRRRRALIRKLTLEETQDYQEFIREYWEYAWNDTHIPDLHPDIIQGLRL